jgi:hypothetical protein
MLQPPEISGTAHASHGVLGFRSRFTAERPAAAALQTARISPAKIQRQIDVAARRSKPRFIFAGIFPSEFRFRPIDPCRCAGYLSSAAPQTACTVRRCNVQVISLDDEAAELTNHGRSGHVPG